MKMQKIMNGLAVLLIMLTACTEEIFVDVPTAENKGITISFTTGGVETKAINNEAYIYATSDELMVNNCYIGVFDGTTKIVARHLNTGDFTKTEDGHFSVNDFQLPIEKNLTIIVIANPLADYSKNSYSEIIALSHTYQNAELNQGTNLTFNPASLIKFGIKENVQLAASTTNITVELKQLAAKVRLNLDIELPESSLPEVEEKIKELSFGKYSTKKVIGMFTKENMNKANDPDNPIVVKESQGELVALPRNAWHADSGPEIAWAYNASTSDGKRIKIGGAMYIIKEKKPSCLFKVTQYEIENVEKSSDLLSPVGSVSSSTLYSLNKSYLADVEKKIDISFYTYEKPKYTGDELSEALMVNVYGQIVDGYVVESKIYEITEAYVWWLTDSGWGDGSSAFETAVQYNEGSMKPLEPSYETEQQTASTYKYPIVINPSYIMNECTDGLVHGNYYEVSGTLKQNNWQLTVNMAPWTLCGVNVGFDSSKYK